MTKATSDTHFGHYNILKFCKSTRAQFVKDIENLDDIIQFIDNESNCEADRNNLKRQVVAEMNKTMVAEWNKAVSPSDTVIHVGDFSFMDDKKTENLLEQLNGKIILVRGNHDSSSTCEIFKRMGHQVHDIHEIRHSNKKVVFCHYPMMSWNGKFHGSLHIHGHSHGTVWPIHSNRAIDAGVDATGKIVVSIDHLVNSIISNPIGDA